jgi:hypothetical protein
MHLDTNLVCDTLLFGRKTVEWMQSPAYWVRGAGTFEQAVTRESWKVNTSPAPELIEAELKKPAPGGSRAKPKRGRPAAVSPRS